jgi:hypothetical protein
VGVCICAFFNVWECVCVGFVMCGCVMFAFCNVGVCVCVRILMCGSVYVCVF